MKNKIKPYWNSYENWECYKNNMYGNRLDGSIVNECLELFRNKEECFLKMQETVKIYSISTKVNFTNKMFNPVSWLGQAMCNMVYGATAKETVNAWFLLTVPQQKEANESAKKVINEWRTNFENIQ